MSRAIRGADAKRTRIYFAPFHTMSDASTGCGSGSSIKEFREAVGRGNWPYDIGDDPSFYMARQRARRLSWGVCRQDVRNRISIGDIVVFFSFRRFKATRDTEYRLCACATVQAKVSQFDLWLDDKLNSLTEYFNLLVRPSKSVPGAWEHFEKTLHGSLEHRDWLWRIADHRGYRKREFEKTQKSNLLKPGAAIRGREIEVARNYVLFSGDQAETHVLSHPPVIAWHSKGGAAEEWASDRFSLALKKLTLGVAQIASGRKRSLRIRNSQRAHRHIVFELSCADAKAWRTRLFELITRRECG